MMSIPAEIDEILGKLPLRIGLYVPDDLLQEWFPPATKDGGVDQLTRTAAEQYAARFECEFQHDAARAEGVFWKWVPAL